MGARTYRLDGGQIVSIGGRRLSLDEAREMRGFYLKDAERHTPGSCLHDRDIQCADELFDCITQLIRDQTAYAAAHVQSQLRAQFPHLGRAA
jgi:hypothetical protein